MSTHSPASSPAASSAFPVSPPETPKDALPAARDNSRWTLAKATAFLKALGLHGNASRAARAVGMSRKSAYALRARAPEFARLWQVAINDVRHMREVERHRQKLPHPLLSRRSRHGPEGTPRRAVRAGDRSGRKG